MALLNSARAYAAKVKRRQCFRDLEMECDAELLQEIADVHPGGARNDHGDNDKRGDAD
jgi:hypothetical protein